MPVVMRQSTGAFERISWVFYVKVNLDPEVDSLLALEIWISTSPCIWQSLPAVLLCPVYEGFWKNYVFLHEGGLVLRSLLSGLVRTWKPEHYFNEQLLCRR